MKKRFLAFVLSMIILAEVILPGNTLAVDAEEVSCTHHREHTAECGYVEAVEGHGCSHVCDENCYKKTLTCSHEGGQHDEACGYAAAVAEVPEAACGHVCGEDCEVQRVECVHTEHDEGCGYAPGVAEIPEVPCSYVHDAAVCGETEENCPHTEHDEACGYVPAVPAVAETPCTHEHTVECMKTEIVCEHQHDEGCGYAPAVPAAAEIPCTHEHTEACCTVETVCGHQHDEGCGYTEGQENSCTHSCDVGCQVPVKECVHTEHDGECGYVEAVEGSECSFVCSECAEAVVDTIFIPQTNRLPAVFGKNVPFVGVGPLLEDITETVSESVPLNSKSRVMVMSMNEDLATAALDNGNSVRIGTADGTVTGSKTVTDTGNKAENGDPIFQIDLKAQSESVTTGESCDFVMVLDMSYSMTGANLAALKEACKTFVNDLYEMSKYSRVAIVTYGGDRNVNRVYIKSYNRNVYVTAVDSDIPVLSYSGSYSDRQKQEWYIEYLEDGYVRFINASNGQALTADTEQEHVCGKTWTTVSVENAVEPVSDDQKWKITQESGYVIIESALKCANGSSRYLDLKSGNSADGTGIGMWETKGTPTYWNLNVVSTDPGYETYYWTDSGNATGYSYRTDASAADSAFLVVSQDGGDGINQKLLNAIDALEIYGEPNEGSHPGEAMEKATRIYQAVKYDDANDICEYTGEHYYDKKRGVLYFADGTPSPTDELQLTYYPDHNEDGENYYGVEYDFEETYRDAQDASNWSIVLKFAKGQEVTNDMQAYFINPYGRHEKSEYYDIGSTNITGCGATVYVLGTNLPTMNVDYATCEKKHPGACVETTGVLDGQGNTVSVCYTQVYWRDGGLFDSYDSRSNEFFYRLSSHRPDGTHIIRGVNMSDVERSWLEKLYNSKYCDETSSRVSAWNGRYPDIICRNQTKSYFVACDDQEAIKEAFKGIAQQTGKELKNLTMIDNITKYFVVSDENGMPLTVGATITMNGLTGTLKYNDVTGQQYIEWVDFDLSPGDGEGKGAEVFDFSFYVIPKEGFMGGNYVQTNDGALLKDENGNEIIKYPDPEVDVDVKEDQVIETEVDARAGATYLESIPYKEILKLVYLSIKDGDDDPTNNTILQMGIENYGLEPWQTDYVYIETHLYDTLVDDSGNLILDKDGNPQKADELNLATEGSLSIRRDHAVIAEVFIWSRWAYDENGELFLRKEEDGPPAGVTAANGVINLTVYYPTFVFNDVSLYYGEPLTEATKVWGDTMEATPYLKWYTNAEYDKLQNPKSSDYKKTEEGKGSYTLNIPESIGKSEGEGQNTVVDKEVPEVYFIVDPIDAMVPYEKKPGSVDTSFYKKYGNYMLKQRIGMNVQVYFKNENDPEYNPNKPVGDNAMRNAFFLHATCDNPDTCDHDECKLAKHTSGSSNNLENYWTEEFYILPKTCQLTIEKTGGLPNETYVFHVKTNTPIVTNPNADPSIASTEMQHYTSVSITTNGEGYGSVTIYEMPVGTFEVTEDTEWSWRYRSSAPKVSWGYGSSSKDNGFAVEENNAIVVLEPEAGQDSASVIFTNSNPVEDWLNGISAAIRNVFTPQSVTPQS